MTKSEKLQAVTEAIRKACPDLLDLQFGTRIKYQELELIVCGRDKGRFDCVEEWNNHRTHNWTLLEDEFEILGQPIGIDSVLRAFRNTPKDREYILTIDQVGGLSYHSVIDDEIVGFEVWDLTKTLDQQEEPVIDLLHNIFYP